MRLRLGWVVSFAILCAVELSGRILTCSTRWRLLTRSNLAHCYASRISGHVGDFLQSRGI